MMKRGGRTRGQISLEYIILIGTILILIIPISYYLTYQTSSNLRVNQADDAVKSIARTVDTVYSMGPGARNYVWITIPKGVTDTKLSTNEIQISLGIYGGVSDIAATTSANLTGEIPNSSGTYKIPIEVLDDGRVRVGT